MNRLATIEQIAQYLEQQARAVRSGAGLAVSDDALSFAAARLTACAWDIRAGLHLPDETAEILP